MDSDLLIQKYKILLDDLYLLKEQLTTLQNSNTELVSSLKSGLLLDKKIFQEEIIVTQTRVIHEIIHELSDTIIPNVQNKFQIDG